jgi:hypothetical protein
MSTTHTLLSTIEQALNELFLHTNKTGPESVDQIHRASKKLHVATAKVAALPPAERNEIKTELTAILAKLEVTQDRMNQEQSLARDALRQLLNRMQAQKSYAQGAKTSK